MFSLLILAINVLPLVYAQGCLNSLSTSYQTPLLAPGYSLQLLTKNITTPRHIVFDSAWNLLIAGDPTGIIALVTDGLDSDGCITIREQKLVVENNGLQLKHGISLSADGKTLYASSLEAAYSWTYDPFTISASDRRTLVVGMSSRGYSSRTLLSSRSFPDFLIISRGSEGNLDIHTLDLATGRSMIRAFNVSRTNEKPYNFTNDGILLGWGLRNSVGIGEDQLGGLWSVENSVDQIMRERIHAQMDNPAEELNWHGYLNQTVGLPGYVGPNYGYPTCFTVWDPEMLPTAGDLQTGDQFTTTTNLTFNDTTCQKEFRGPHVSLDMHTAPTDIKFHPRTGDAWIPFHGSWSREHPVGYKLSYVPFDAQMQPIPAKNSKNATVDVLWNKDNTLCPLECFRPVGVAIDARGRVWMTSDNTGEVFVLTPPEGYLNGTQVLAKPSHSGASPASMFASTSKLLVLCGLGWFAFLVAISMC